MSDYQAFLESKRLVHAASGFHVDRASINPILHEFQRDIVQWSLARGKSAIFADCGMGKTFIQLEWARMVCAHTGGRVLILAPLAVAAQTCQEARKLDIDCVYSREGPKDGITITNYDMLDHFSPADFVGVVLDESSILKSYSGATRNQIIKMFESTPYRLACTATPAPNDYTELGNHSEFLGAMSRAEMLATFFVHDGGETSVWRLKKHGVMDFWRWICSWAVVIRKPSDLGYSDEGYDLPPLNIIKHIMPASTEDAWKTGQLFPSEVASLSDRRAVKRASMDARSAKASEIIGDSDDAWVLWCQLNDESESLAAAVDGVEVRGSDSPETKEKALMDFAGGGIKRIVTKPSIAGFGMNWQHCANVVFGATDSYEQFYQAVRRCWRYGQTQPVNVHIIADEREMPVIENMMRKERESSEMFENVIKQVRGAQIAKLRGLERSEDPYRTAEESGDGWGLFLGDCAERIKSVDSNSVHYSIFSPPFGSLYTYSNSARDMGNVRSDDEFFAHFQFLVRELFRVIMPGRLVSFHCMNLPTSKERDGVIGIRDFRGDLIRLFAAEGFIYHSEVCIWKDPVTAMQRTKALGLLHKQIKKDSCMSRQGIPDYLVAMRKPGVNPERVSHTAEDFPVSLWQNYASPVWMDINPNETLQYRSARDNNDERHICPLQLEVIRRALKLWSNPGDTVLSPFAGIGSEGYIALEMGRKFIGFELKKSYFDCAVKNLRNAASVKHDAPDMFAGIASGEVADFV